VDIFIYITCPAFTRICRKYRIYDSNTLVYISFYPLIHILLLIAQSLDFKGFPQNQGFSFLIYCAIMTGQSEVMKFVISRKVTE